MNALEQLAKDAQTIFDAAVRGASATTLMRGLNWPAVLAPLSKKGRLHVVAIGKAAIPMAAAFEAGCPRHADAAVAVAPHGYRASLPKGIEPPKRFEVLEAAHPVPDEAGQRAADRVLELAEALGEGDLLLVLLSGGGSALLPAFAPGIPLADAQETFRALLGSGAAIRQLNCVRKHLSRIGGGRLAAIAAPAAVHALILSDVLGDDLSAIAGGPTVPDPTTFQEAAAILNQYELWDRVPATVRSRITHGMNDAAQETPKPGDPVFERTQTQMLGGLRSALEAARQQAEALGYLAVIRDHTLEGEAGEMGRQIARAALDAVPDAPVCLIWGGETTVTLGAAAGKGGRNQELALAAAVELDGAKPPVVVLSGGTDGIDGPTDAAGAWVDPGLAAAGREIELSAGQALKDHAAYHFLDAMDRLLKPGPTHTNVNDVVLALIGEA